ncbi:MAG: TOBE domain-containing protein, partial [Treponema sp.]|nr:TOBE domain-containing protein [Treponema sp.]
GKKALVAIRPEDFQLGDAGGVNVIEALVHNVEYCGFSSQVDLQTDSGDIIHMRTHESLEQNVRARIHVSPERALAYPAEEG